MTAELDREVRPLNGAVTWPMSPKAAEALAKIRKRALPSSEFNPGIVNRLLRTRLVEIVWLSSPYPSHKGKPCPHLAAVARKGAE